MESPRSRPTDQELVRHALIGSRDAAAELLRRHEPAMRRQALAKVSRMFEGQISIDDVMQDFYLRICRNGFRALAVWQGLTDPAVESIAAYFAAILRNVIMDAAREFQRRGLEVDIDDEDLDRLMGPADPDNDAIAGEQMKVAMRHCIDTAINDGQRQVVRLSLEGRTHAQIGSLLSIGEGNSRIRLHRALARLRACIERNVSNDAPARGVE